MSEFLEKLLEKPESYRRKIAFLVTIVFGVVIFSIWLLIARYNIKQAFNRVKVPTSPLPTLQENITTEMVKIKQ